MTLIENSKNQLNLLIKVKNDDAYYYFTVNKKNWNDMGEKLKTFNIMNDEYTYHDIYEDIYEFYKNCEILEINHNKFNDVINFLFLSNWILKDIENHIIEIEKRLLYEENQCSDESDSNNSNDSDDSNNSDN